MADTDNAQQLAHLIEQLHQTQALLSAQLMAATDRQDWRPTPDAWSPRQIGAHLAVAETGALWARIQQIASGAQPQFDLYLNSPADFPDDDLPVSLAAWRKNRQAVIDFVWNLSPAQLAYTGTHAHWGELTITDYLQRFIEHDEEHLAELQADYAVLFPHP